MVGILYEPGKLLDYLGCPYCGAVPCIAKDYEGMEICTNNKDLEIWGQCTCVVCGRVFNVRANYKFDRLTSVKDDGRFEVMDA